ncbi:probable Bax inhibitor 1 [Harmonia axyridis]|uniref:probable Bax inhibitor 1 n=1 Tax=Harmonia axyridis TaxID=115357 RepID=UPI001E27530F|nr:probable Bax inhibitor 1 [Harmonia axyridis]
MEPSVEHLKNVYVCLAVSILSAAVGLLSIGSLLKNLLSIALLSTGGSTLFFLLVLILPDIPDKNRSLRFSFLLGFAGFSGIGLTNIFRSVMQYDPILSITALLETCLIFSSLSACAIFSERGRWLFLGIPLTVLLFTLIIVSFANVVDESKAVSRAIVYLSLFAMCGLVLYDTQVIIERYNNKDADFIGQTMNVFTDFIGIYRRLLIIGVDNKLRETSEDSDEDEEFLFGLFSSTAAPMHALL